MNSLSSFSFILFFFQLSVSTVTEQVLGEWKEESGRVDINRILISKFNQIYIFMEDGSIEQGTLQVLDFDKKERKNCTHFKGTINKDLNFSFILKTCMDKLELKQNSNNLFFKKNVYSFKKSADRGIRRKITTADKKTTKPSNTSKQNQFKVKAFKLKPSDRKPKPVLTPEKTRIEKFAVLTPEKTRIEKSVENRNKYTIEHQHSATKVIAKDYFGRTFIKHHWERSAGRKQGYQGRDQSRDLNVLAENTIKLYPNLEKETVRAWERAHVSKSQEFSKYKNLIESSAELKTPEHYKISKKGVKSPVRYSSRTIELAIITDPSIFTEVKARILLGKGKDKDVIQEVYRLIHELMKAAETFLLHPTISRHGGFKININGVRVLKDWGELGKMSKRNLLLSVLHDLGNYLKIINQHSDGDQHSYDGVILFTGNTNFTDGDGYSYIGHVCLLDCPVVSKVLFEGSGVDKNMGRLVAHELGHLLGAEHDQDVQNRTDCKPGHHIMSVSVNSSMNTWSPCSRDAIDKVVAERTIDGNCFIT